MFDVPETLSLRSAATYSAPLDYIHRMVMEPLEPEFEKLFKHKGAWLGRFALPAWQRPLVWDRERKLRFIESMWLGYSIGNYVVNDTSRSPRHVGDNGCYHPLHGLLIDGQQRIDAFRSYFMDEFPVFGAKWSEVPQNKQRQCLFSTIFTRVEIAVIDEAVLREVYNRMAYGGVAHKESDRA